MGMKKWRVEERDLHVGDIVLIVDDASPRGFWPLARVTNVFPSGDGTVRTVEVRTAAGRTYRRPASKICFVEDCPN